MKSKLIAFFLTLGLSVSSHAQFGGLGGMLGGGGGGGGDISAQVESFNKDAVLIREAVAFALVQIVGALGDKTQIAAAKEQAANLSKSTDTKEAENLQGTVIKNSLSAATSLLSDSKAKEKMEQLSPELKKKVGQAIFAVGVSALKLPGTVDTGKKIMQGVGTNPMNITKAVPVKDGLALFADVLPKLPDLVSTGLKLMRDVKVDPGNPSADSKVEKVSPSFPAE
jgi:hypothetical protein